MYVLNPVNLANNLCICIWL